MVHSRRSVMYAAVAAAFLFAAPVASATPFNFIRIGDLDGFGFTNTSALVRATGVPHTTAADTNGNNLLEVTEFLPDLNKDGATATGAGDDFDNRSAAEKAQALSTVTGIGFLNTGSSGAKWTDVALSTSSTLPDFPDPGGNGLPNQPRFVYSLFVATGDIDPTAGLFFNVLFGDYDVVPANITLTFAGGGTRTIALVTQPGPADGLIQAAFANLLFTEVFTATAGGWNGFLQVDFIAPNEPFTAFDFTELSTTAIATGQVPEPASVLLVATGGLGLLVNALRRRRAARQ